MSDESATDLSSALVHASRRVTRGSPLSCSFIGAIGVRWWHAVIYGHNSHITTGRSYRRGVAGANAWVSPGLALEC